MDAHKYRQTGRRNDGQTQIQADGRTKWQMSRVTLNAPVAYGGGMNIESVQLLVVPFILRGRFVFAFEFISWAMKKSFRHE